MFTFGENKDRKRFGRVTRGWHPAKIHQAVLKNDRRNNPRQYIMVDFEIIHERQNKDKLVKSFFNYNRNGKPDVRFLDLGEAAGLKGVYETIHEAFSDLIGKELMVFVIHRYKNKKRFDRAENFKPLYSDDELNFSEKEQE
jgi:hypothetical protein